eukprot:1144653-Pelagomonas_calceolata.AAC.7
MPTTVSRGRACCPALFAAAGTMGACLFPAGLELSWHQRGCSSCCWCGCAGLVCICFGSMVA